MDGTGTIDTACYRSRVTIGRSPDEVFTALATLEGVAGWWMPAAGAATEGGELRLEFPPGVGVFRVDVARPAARVAWTVVELDFLPDWVGTRIVFDLRSDGSGGTVLAFRHDGLVPQLECYEQCEQGWNYYLPSLRDHVETGSGRPGNRH